MPFALPLTIRRSGRARRVRLRLVPGLGLEVVVPPGFDVRRVDAVLDARRDWIETTAVRLREEGYDLSGLPPELPDEIAFPAVDERWSVRRVVRSGAAQCRENAGSVLLSGPDDPDALIPALQRFVVRRAADLLRPRLEALSAETGLRHQRMCVRSQRTRWGSCTSRGVINLNAKLLFLPPELLRQALLHELCHLRQMNHSDRFWKLVASFEPDWRRLESRLRRGTSHVPAWMEHRPAEPDDPRPESPSGMRRGSETAKGPGGRNPRPFLLIDPH